MYLFQCGPNRDRLRRTRTSSPCRRVPRAGQEKRKREKGCAREKEKERERSGRKAKTINKIAGSEGARARIRRVASLLPAGDHETRV